MLAATFRLGKPAHHAIDGAANFDLQPFAAAPLFIRTGAPLCHDPLEQLRLGNLKQSLPLFFIMIRKTQPFAPRHDGGEFSFALLERDLAPVFAVEVKQVERIVQDRNVGLSGRSLAAGTKAGALLHQAERRFTLFIERDDLAVEDRVFGLDESRQIPQFGIAARQLILIARDQPHRSLFDERDGTVAIPLNFKEPVRTVERLIDGLGQHAVDRRGHGTLDGVSSERGGFLGCFERRGGRIWRRGGDGTLHRFFLGFIVLRVRRVLAAFLWLFFLIEPGNCLGEPCRLQFPAPCWPAARPLFRSPISGDFVHAALAEHGLVDVSGIVSLDNVVVVLFDHQPLVALAAGAPALHLDQRKVSFQSLAIQPKFQVAFRQHGDGVCFRAGNIFSIDWDRRERRPRAHIPHHDAAGAIVAFGNVSFEIEI